MSKGQEAPASPESLRLVVHDYSGHPFAIALSRELAGRGHTVCHLHCPSYTSGKGALERRAKDPSSLTIEGIELGGPFAKYSPMKRFLQEIRYARRFVKRMRSVRPEVVLSANAPLLAHVLIGAGCRRVGARFVFWQQDIYSVAMQDALGQRMPGLGRVIGRVFLALERWLAKQSSAVVPITNDFVPLLRRWGVPTERIHVIGNWAPLDELPLEPRDNEWARHFDLVGKRVYLYAGTLGMKHNPRLLLELARHFSTDADVRIVIVSESVGSDWLRAEGERQCLKNLIFTGFQPYSLLPKVLASADVLLAILEPSASIFSVPSKVLTYHCAARPLLLAVPSENLAARIVSENGSGLVVDPQNVDGFIRAAVSLREDPELRAKLGTRARQAAETRFDIESIGDRFVEILAEQHPQADAPEVMPIGRLRGLAARDETLGHSGADGR